jgi:hypothetical protein
MNDIKSVVSVIKILERTIGILENCTDVGKFPDATRKRVIEMLNKATLEIYFSDNVRESTSGEEISEKDRKVEKSEVLDIVEETVPEETAGVQPVLETVAVEEYMDENVPETVSEEEIADTVPEEEYASEEEDVPEEEMFQQTETVEETQPEENTVSEDSIFMHQDASDKPLFEWELPEIEPVGETRESSKDEEINLLKLQLEEERKRLEQELQNWQDEKRKRDEEILATQKLLKALQQQATMNQTQQAQEPQPVPQPNQQSRQQVQQPQPQQFRQPAKEPLFKKETARKEDSQESATLLDSFGSKKVLHENFEADNVVNQISTPVSSLPKAIGINDKFRFIKELFGGDSDLYNETVKRLDSIGSLVSAISYIESNFSWDKNSDSVKQLISLIRRRYM